MLFFGPKSRTNGECFIVFVPFCLMSCVCRRSSPSPPPVNLQTCLLTLWFVLSTHSKPWPVVCLSWGVTWRSSSTTRGPGSLSQVRLCRSESRVIRWFHSNPVVFRFFFFFFFSVSVYCRRCDATCAEDERRVFTLWVKLWFYADSLYNHALIIIRISKGWW